MTTFLGSLFQLSCGEGETLPTDNTGMCGECSQWDNHTGFATAQGGVYFPGPQALECSARALSQVGPALCALPRYKSFRFLGASQGHRPRWSVHFVNFPGLSNSGDWVLGEHIVPGGTCIFCTSLVLADQFPGCAMRA